MAEILRTWQCLNPRCRAAFDAWGDNPACESCGCVRVSWVPGGGHVGKVAGGVDAEFRGLATACDLPNLKSARRDECAKVLAQQPVVTGEVKQFAPGFAAPVGNGPTCVPSSQTVNFKTSAGVGMPLAPNRSVPGIHTATRIEARHSGRP